MLLLPSSVGWDVSCAARQGEVGFDCAQLNTMMLVIIHLYGNSTSVRSRHSWCEMTRSVWCLHLFLWPSSWCHLIVYDGCFEPNFDNGVHVIF